MFDMLSIAGDDGRCTPPIRLVGGIFSFRIGPSDRNILSSSSSPSHASANSSARLPNPFPLSSVLLCCAVSLTPEKSPFLSRDDSGRGVVGVCMEHCEDLRLKDDVREACPALFGLGDVRDKSILWIEDCRRRGGVLGDEGIVALIRLQNSPGQPLNTHMSRWMRGHGEVLSAAVGQSLGNKDGQFENLKTPVSRLRLFPLSNDVPSTSEIC